MGSVTTRVTQHASLAFVEHNTADEDTWQLAYTSVTTSDGAANGTTLIDTYRDTDVDDGYNGRWWVHITSGANKGLWRRIGNDGGTGTFSFEGWQDAIGFPNQVLQDVTYEVWQSPEPVVVVDSSADANTVVDAVRDEANDYWVGYYLVCIAGTYRGQKALITGFVNATSTFTVGAGFGGALTAGDVCVLRRYIDVTSVNNGLAQAWNDRPVHRLDGSRGDGSVGPKSGTFGFESVVLGVHRNSSDTDRTKLGGLLKACGFYEQQSNVPAGAATPTDSTTTQIEIDTATWEDYEIGGGISVAGEQAFVTALGDGDGGDDNITITPALGGVGPDAGVMVPRTVNYLRNRRADHGDYGAVTLVMEIDGIRTTMTGCRGNVTLSGETDLMMNFEFQVDHFIRDFSSEIDYTGDAYPAYQPIQATQRRCYFGATAVELGGISASLNNEVAARKVQGAYGINGRAGFGHSGTNPGVSCRKLMSTATNEELDADERWFSRTSHDLMIFWGDRLYGGCALRIPAAVLVAEPKPEDDEGMQVTPFVFEAISAGTTTDPDDTLIKIPDFVLSFS